MIVSKATKRHCTGSGTVQSQGGRVGNVKQVGFESRPEDSYGRCGSNKIRQTVPDALLFLTYPWIADRTNCTEKQAKNLHLQFSFKMTWWGWQWWWWFVFNVMTEIRCTRDRGRELQISSSGRIVYLMSGAFRFRMDFKNCYLVHP